MSCDLFVACSRVFAVISVIALILLDCICRTHTMSYTYSCCMVRVCLRRINGASQHGPGLIESL